MKSKIAIYIDGEHPFCFKEFNFHPGFIYPIFTAKEAGLSPDVFSNSRAVIDLLELYGITAVEIKSVDEMGHTIVLDPVFTLTEAETLRAVAAAADKQITYRLPFINYRNFLSGIEPQSFQELKPTELFSYHNEKDQVLIDAWIRSDFYKTRPVKLSGGYVIEHGGTKGKPKVLFSAPYAFFRGPLRQKIEENFDVIFAFNAPYEKTKKLLHDREIWITGTCPPYHVDKNLIDAGSGLKIVATPSTGTNHIDVPHLQKKNIQLLSIKSSPVIEQIYASSEFSFSLLLAVIKKIPFSTDAAGHGNWRELESVFRNIELHGKTLGLIGYGRIGKKMARFAESFGMKILAYDPFKKISEPYVSQLETRGELLKASDIVSLHYHLTPETINSFTKTDFDRMKDGAYFINTARGELVRENDLIAALESGKLKAAGVDVITDEHVLNKWDHPLIAYARHHKNLLVSPHIAGCTIDSEGTAMNDLLDQVMQTWNKGL